MNAPLHLGDCLDPVAGLASLDDDAVAITLTDPPFDARTHRAGCERANSRGRLRTGALPFPPLDSEKLPDLAAQLVRVTRRWIIVFAAERQLEPWAVAIESAGGRFVRFGTAVKRNPAPRFLGDAPGVGVEHLVIGYARAGRTTWNGGGRAAVWEAGAAMFDCPPGTPRGRKQLHPSQKPLDLMRALVEDFTSPGELILDPFAGSGSTLVAAKELGRVGVGWEIDPANHATALARLEAAAIGAPLRVPRRRRHLVSPAASACATSQGALRFDQGACWQTRHQSPGRGPRQRPDG